MILNIIGYKAALPDVFLKKEISVLKGTSYILGKISADKNDEYYPSRSDEKIMRQDVKVSILLMNHLIDEMNLKEGVDAIPLYVANGAFIEDNTKYLTKISNEIKKFTKETTDEEKVKKIYRASPPLVALETLTNSTMSFIAQYAGFKNENTTFGNTSISAYYAIKQALNALKNKKKAVVLSSNCSGNHSYLTNSTITEHHEDWNESASVGCLVLSNSEAENENNLCKITYLKNSNIIPDLENNKIDRQWKSLLPDIKADLIIFSGAYTNFEFNLDMEYCKSLCPNVYSLYKEYGNMGVSNIILSLIKGIEFLKGKYQKIDILDRDIYGRESLIRIEKC